MGGKTYHNYEVNDFGKSVITTDDRGVIVETGAIHLQKYKGQKIDDAIRDLEDRRSARKSDKYQGTRDLGKTQGSRVIGSSDGTKPRVPK